MPNSIHPSFHVSIDRIISTLQKPLPSPLPTCPKLCAFHFIIVLYPPGLTISDVPLPNVTLYPPPPDLTQYRKLLQKTSFDCTGLCYNLPSQKEFWGYFPTISTSHPAPTLSSFSWELEMEKMSHPQGFYTSSAHMCSSPWSGKTIFVDGMISEICMTFPALPQPLKLLGKLLGPTYPKLRTELECKSSHSNTVSAAQ